MYNNILIVCVFISGIWLGISIWRWRKRRRLALSRLRGKQGELQADLWLSQNGFTNIKDQTEQSFAYLVDSQLCTFKVRPDFLANYHGQKWLIEVKTGKSASPKHSDTRRQIREYSQLWPRHKCGLFDADKGILHEVSFKKTFRVRDQKIKAYSIFLSTPFITFVMGLISGCGISWLLT